MGNRSFRNRTGINKALSLTLPAGADRPVPGLVAALRPAEAAPQDGTELKFPETGGVEAGADARRVFKQELADRAEGIMIEAVPEHVHAVPVFQHGGGPQGDGVQPAGRGGLLQNPKRLIYQAAVAEGGQQINCGEEAGIQVVFGGLQLLFELGDHQGFFLLADQIQRQSADIGRLMARLDRAVGADHVFVVGGFDFG